jgi:hypothetical protein
VPQLLQDLVSFVNRDDIPAVAQPPLPMPNSRPSIRSETAMGASAVA